MSARDRVVLTLICVVGLIAGSWLLVIQPKRDQAAALGRQVTSAQAQLDSARAQLASGNAARAAFAGSYTTLVRLGEAVPTDDRTGSLIYQLQGAADAAKVEFQNLTFNSAAGGAGGGAGAAGAGGPAGAGAAPATSASARSASSLPPGATIGAAGFPIEPFTFTFQGSFFHLGDFLGRLQDFVIAGNRRLSVSGRLMTLDAITLGPAPSGFPQMTATISATTYLLPASQGLLGGATAAGPAPAGTQTVSTQTSGRAAPPAVVTPFTVR